MVNSPSAPEAATLPDLRDFDPFSDLREGSILFEDLRAVWRPKSHETLGLGPSEHAQLYTYMTLHRQFEETLERLFRQDLVPGTVFFGRGNEATAVGSAFALGPRDILSPLHRNLGARFVRGQTLTMRLCGHSVYDRFRDYVPEEQLSSWEARDPIGQYETHLLSQGLLSEEALREIREKIEADIEEAVEFAKASPFPDPKGVEEGVYADG